MLPIRNGLLGGLVLAAVCALAPGQTPARGVMGIEFDQEQKTAGVTVKNVLTGGPAALAGLQPGDVLVQKDGVNVTPKTLASAIAAKAPGSVVNVVYLRNGKRRTATLTLAERRSAYQRAADLGDAAAQAAVGGFYFEEKNSAEACRWWRRAAEAGYAPAQLGLGWCYADGIAPQVKDAAQAVYWYRRAADQGNSEAQFRLALAYGNGEGVARDDGEAMRWARASADLKHPGGMALLGWRYRVASPPNPAEAARWLARAQASSPTEALRNYIEQQTAALVASGQMTRSQFDAIAREEAARIQETLNAGNVHLQTEPGRVQAYVDDVYRGTTSESDRQLLLEGLTPGAHRLRLSAEGYKDSATTVVVDAGAITPVDATLERAGPRPLTLRDVEDALRNGVANARLSEMVRQYGVDFALSDEIERRLRGEGADDGLLLAIAKGRRS